MKRSPSCTTRKDGLSPTGNFLNEQGTALHSRQRHGTGKNSTRVCNRRLLASPLILPLQSSTYSSLSGTISWNYFPLPICPPSPFSMVRRSPADCGLRSSAPIRDRDGHPLVHSATGYYALWK